MSTHAESHAKLPPGGIATSPPLGGGRFALLERWLLEPIGERINPILVKETRQSLKSRQFVITFGLVLFAGWVWSLLGLALVQAETSYEARGMGMFMGYFVILAFPLLVIVPFGTFRSLASEQEDRTYELLSITDLNPRQIVSGKLGSAIAQMLIYLSAIAPCLAFTYMLRGIDFPTILFVVFYTALGSLGLSVVGLLAGTLTGEKHWQVVMSVLLIMGLLLAFFTGCQMASGLLFFGTLPFRSAEFWQGNAAFLTGYVTYFALVFYAAVAQISFPSDNRSTRLRVIMLIQHVCFVGWMAWLIVAEIPDIEFLIVFLIFIAFHWYAMGTFMTGEWSELSMRVKRRLPQSFLGRMFLTWFSPGPGTGYVLAVSGMLGALMFVAGMVGHGSAWSATRNWSQGEVQCTLAFGTLATAYIVSYLGIGLLLIRTVRRFTQMGMFAGVLIQVVLVIAGIGIPLVVDMMMHQWGYMQYSLLQMPDPFWTLIHITDRSVLPTEAPVLLVVVPLTAVVVFLLNLPGVARELRNVRIAKPERVAEEDAELAALAAPPEPKRISPWDEA